MSLKRMIFSFVSGILASSIVFCATWLWTTPLFIYDARDHGSVISLVVKNSGFTQSEYIVFDLIVVDSLNFPPNLIEAYTDKPEDILSLLKYQKLKDGKYIIQYRDTERSPVFSKNKTLSLEFISRNPQSSRNEIENFKFEAFQLRSAYLLSADDWDIIKSTAPTIIFIIGIFSLVFTAGIFFFIKKSLPNLIRNELNDTSDNA